MVLTDVKEVKEFLNLLKDIADEKDRGLSHLPSFSHVKKMIEKGRLIIKSLKLQEISLEDSKKKAKTKEDIKKIDQQISAVRSLSSVILTKIEIIDNNVIPLFYSFIDAEISKIETLSRIYFDIRMDSLKSPSDLSKEQLANVEGEISVLQNNLREFCRNQGIEKIYLAGFISRLKNIGKNNGLELSFA